MIKIEENDVVMGFGYITKNSLDDIKKVFHNKNRNKILEIMIECVESCEQMGLTKAESILCTTEYSYNVWRTYYLNQKTISDIFGNADYHKLEDDIIDLIDKNIYDRIYDRFNELNEENLMIFQEERLTTAFEENSTFFTMVDDLTYSYLGENPLMGGLLAFFAIEERMKRLQDTDN